MSDDLPNETNLVPPRMDRRTVARMRNKLATSGKMAVRTEKPAAARPKRSVRIWPFVIALGLALGGMNLLLHTRQDRISGAIPGNGPGSAQPAPPPGLSLDEQARFWCYAAYDYPKLKARFKLPKAVVYDKRAARANLDRILAEDLGAEVRREIFAIQQAHPDPVPKKPAAKPQAEPRAKPAAPARPR